MQQPPSHRLDLPARILAFAVFLLGIGLLCLVFGLAWTLFHTPVAHLGLPNPPGSPPPPAANIGIALAGFGRQLLLLILMTAAGSLVAGKGIQLYFSAHPHNLPAAPAPSPSLDTPDKP